MNVEIGTIRPRQSQKRNTKMEFSLQCGVSYYKGCYPVYFSSYWLLQQTRNKGTYDKKKLGMVPWFSSMCIITQLSKTNGRGPWILLNSYSGTSQIIPCCSCSRGCGHGGGPGRNRQMEKLPKNILYLQNEKVRAKTIVHWLRTVGTNIKSMDGANRIVYKISLKPKF